MPFKTSTSEPTVQQDDAQISVCIVCRNEADKLAPCLESVQWADEIILMDLSSSDDSVGVARQYGARVIMREPFPIVEPLRNELALVALGEWILALDPDERVTPGLACELRRLASHQEIDAVVIPMSHYDLGYPPSNPLHRYDPKPRMYRRSRIQWPMIPNKLPIIPEDRTYFIPNHDDMVLIHDRNRSIPEVVERVGRYAPAEAQAMVDEGKVFTAKDMVAVLADKFYKQFYRGQPWKDGVPGMLRASFMVLHHFYVWAAFWQLSGARRTPEDDKVVQRIGNVLNILQFFFKVVGTPFRLTKSLRHK